MTKFWARKKSDLAEENVVGNPYVWETKEPVVLFSRSADGTKKRHLFSFGDLREVVLMYVYTATVRMLPEERWAKVAHTMAGFRHRRHLRKRFPAMSEALEAALGPKSDGEKLGWFRAVRNARHRRLVLSAAEIAGRDWSPAVELEGAELLAAAAEEGRGVLIWCTSFMAQNLVGKRALHQAGFPCHQVSVSEHGLSFTRLGQRILNPPLLKAEDRYLAGRILFARSETYAVAKRISQALRRNQIVLMTNNVYSGSSFAELRFGRSSNVTLATAPANFAVRGGAALFTMCTREIEPFRSYRAVLKPVAIEASEALPEERTAGGPSGTIAAVLAKVRDRMLADITEAPDQFTLWGGQVKGTSRFAAVAQADETLRGTDEMAVSGEA